MTDGTQAIRSLLMVDGDHLFCRGALQDPDEVLIVTMKSGKIVQAYQFEWAHVSIQRPTKIVAGGGVRLSKDGFTAKTREAGEVFKTKMVCHDLILPDNSLDDFIRGLYREEFQPVTNPLDDYRIQQLL